MSPLVFERHVTCRICCQRPPGGSEHESTSHGKASSFIAYKDKSHVASQLHQQRNNFHHHVSKLLPLPFHLAPARPLYWNVLCRPRNHIHPESDFLRPILRFSPSKGLSALDIDISSHLKHIVGISLAPCCTHRSCDAINRSPGHLHWCCDPYLL